MIRPPPSPLRHLCLVAVCHGDAITRYISPPKDAEASVASCLANCKAGPGPVGFIWGLPGNYISAYIYLSPDFENFFTLLLVGPSLSRVFPTYCGGRLVVLRLLRARGSFRAIYYCRMPVSHCIMTRNATRSRDFEKGWAALSSPFCRITSTQT